MFDFQKLTVYQKAKSFHFDCKNIINSGILEPYIIDQLGRASYSIPLNIAEGSAKLSKRDRRNFFVIARGSLFECASILELLFDENHITKLEYDKLLHSAEELSKILYSMIKNLS